MVVGVRLVVANLIVCVRVANLAETRMGYAMALFVWSLCIVVLCVLMRCLLRIVYMRLEKIWNGQKRLRDDVLDEYTAPSSLLYRCFA